MLTPKSPAPTSPRKRKHSDTGPSIFQEDVEACLLVAPVQSADDTAFPDADNNPPSSNDLPIISQSDSEDENIPLSDDDDYTDNNLNGVEEQHIVTDLNNQFDRGDDALPVELDYIIDHRYVAGVLELQVSYTDGSKSWHPLSLIKTEDPSAIADFVLNNDLGKVSNGIHRRWARAYQRSLRRAIRRLRRVHFFGFESTTYRPSKKKNSRRAKRARRAMTDSPVPSKKASKRVLKYGLEVPRSWKDILRIDAENKNRAWRDAVEKEVGALLLLGCFDFRAPDFKPTPDYQFCRLHFVYDIKYDLRCKARLVADGSRIDPKGLSTLSLIHI